MALISLGAITLTSGVHIVAMQGFAWARMFAEYNRILTVEDALDLTLSGKEICGMCLAAEEIRENMDNSLEDFANSISPAIPIVLLATSTLDLPERSCTDLSFPNLSRFIEYTDSLEPPPPRIA